MAPNKINIVVTDGVNGWQAVAVLGRKGGGWAISDRVLDGVAGC